MKFCKQCQQEKQETEFYKNKLSKDGIGLYCKKCDNARKTNYLRKKSKEEGRKSRYYTLDAKEDLKNGIKYCPRCKQKKVIDQFLKNKASATGIDFHCVECKRKLVKEYGFTKEKLHEKYISRREQQRDTTLKFKFGITLDYYNELLIKQNYQCAVCGITPEENGKALAVDHNHLTKKVRGLLCANCNAALGFIQEDIKVAKGLIKYIESNC